MRQAFIRKEERLRTKLRRAGVFGPLLALCALLMLVVATPALAAPQIPHRLYGTLTISGQPAGAGITITAYIDGAAFAATETDSSGRYGYSPAYFMVPADDPDTPTIEGGVNGDMVEMVIGGNIAGEVSFASGTITSLVLAVSSGAPTSNVPGAPTGLVATALSPSQVMLTWADTSGNESGFKIARSTDGSSFDNIAGIGADLNNFTDSSLQETTCYYYLVMAFNDTGESALAGPVSVTTLTAPAPQAPPAAPATSVAPPPVVMVVPAPIPAAPSPPPPDATTEPAPVVAPQPAQNPIPQPGPTEAASPTPSAGPTLENAPALPANPVVAATPSPATQARPSGQTEVADPTETSKVILKFRLPDFDYPLIGAVVGGIFLFGFLFYARAKRRRY